jgi:hypothetical protein
VSQQGIDKLFESYGILNGDVPWHENGREHLPGFSMRSMGFAGYRAQVENRLRQYGWAGEELPSDRYLRECLSNQTCAKRAASAWLRRNRKLSQR